jgi:hypothetical protein
MRSMGRWNLPKKISPQLTESPTSVWGAAIDTDPKAQRPEQRTHKEMVYPALRRRFLRFDGSAQLCECGTDSRRLTLHAIADLRWVCGSRILFRKSKIAASHSCR